MTCGHVKLNLETNHATLAGHTMMHELAYARCRGARQHRRQHRRPAAGWDTDHSRRTSISPRSACCDSGAERTRAGRRELDAKVRRESFDPIDLFYAHIGAMTRSPAGEIAAAIRKDGALSSFVKQRYSSFDTGIGRRSNPESDV